MAEETSSGLLDASHDATARARVHTRLLRVPVSEEEEERRTKLPKTVGERAYFWFQFLFVKGLILGATAFIGYHAKFGSETNPNAILRGIRKFQQWCIRWIETPIAGAGERTGEKLAKSIGGGSGRWIGAKTHEVIAVFGGAFASTMVLFHGGNVVAPVVQYFENHRRGFIAGANRRWGKPGDEALGNEKFEFLQHQTVGDVIKGRVVAWLTTFSMFVAGFLLIGKMKGTDTYRLDAYEDWCARAVSGLGKNSKLGHIPLTQDLAKLAKDSPEMFAGAERKLFTYKTARILALDFYATTMSILVWNFAARLSARSRHHGEPFITALKSELLGRKHHTALPAPEQTAPTKKEEAIAPNVEHVAEEKTESALARTMEIAAEGKPEADKAIEAESAERSPDTETAAETPPAKHSKHGVKHEKTATVEKPGSIIHHAMAVEQHHAEPHAAHAQ